MEIRKAIAASAGYAIGEAFVLDIEQYRIPRKYVQQHEIESEIERFLKARDSALKEQLVTISKITKKAGPVVTRIIESHVAMLKDDNIKDDILSTIRENKCSPEYSVSSVIRKKLKLIKGWGDSTFSQRIEQDFIDVERTLLRHLIKGEKEDVFHLKKPVILVADDLAPAQTATLDKEKIRGIVTNKGSKTSHTSLVAASLGIPAVVGMGNITADVSGGDLLIVDGVTGTVFINPDENTTKRYKAMQRNFYVMDQKLTTELKHIPARTRDGVKITLYANIEFPDEIQLALEYGADGIGLYRTEFLYLSNNFVPTEKQHIDAYKRAIQFLSNKKLIIRTLDIGADKMPYDGFSAQANPFLGVRAVRLCLERMDLFQPQLRAILRVSSLGNVSMMLPMITTVQEIQQIKSIFNEVKRGLKEDGEIIKEDIEMGIMLEVPSAALICDILAYYVDFFSIGTNDLIAYLMAVDRTNEKLASLYQPTHPAILRTLKNIIDTANKHKKPVSLCGEMASDVIYTMLLVGMGLRIFSVVPHMIPEIKKILTSITVSEAQQIAQTALRFTNSKDTEEYLKEETRKRVPELF